MGWAGSAAVYELQRYNEFALANNKRPITFKAADKAPFIGGRAEAARVISGGTPNPIHGIMRDLFQRTDPSQDDYLQWHNVDWYDGTYYNMAGLEFDPVASAAVVAAQDMAVDCVYDNVETVANGWQADDTVLDVLANCSYALEDPTYAGTLDFALRSWDFDLEVRIGTLFAHYCTTGS